MEGAAGGAGLPAGGDVEPAGFFSLTRFSGSLKQQRTQLTVLLIFS